LTLSPVHSGTMGQESGEIWTAETLLQPILPKSDRAPSMRHFLADESTLSNRGNDREGAVASPLRRGNTPTRMAPNNKSIPDPLDGSYHPGHTRQMPRKTEHFCVGGEGTCENNDKERITEEPLNDGRSAQSRLHRPSPQVRHA
jgi:hypothetical protein